MNKLGTSGWVDRKGTSENNWEKLTGMPVKVLRKSHQRFKEKRERVEDRLDQVFNLNLPCKIVRTHRHRTKLKRKKFES